MFYSPKISFFIFTWLGGQQKSKAGEQKTKNYNYLHFFQLNLAAKVGFYSWPKQNPQGEAGKRRKKTQLELSWSSTVCSCGGAGEGVGVPLRRKDRRECLLSARDPADFGFWGRWGKQGKFSTKPL